MITAHRFDRVAPLALALVTVMACGTLAAPAPPVEQAGTCGITTTGRVVAVGDVHGAYEQYLSILRETLLIDTRQRWIGGNALLVQVGDVVDRGADSRKVLDLIRRLEGEASKAGGGVLFLLGNHEVMRMQGRFDYVSAGEYKAFQSPDAAALRDRLYEHVVGQQNNQAKAKGEAFDAKAFRKRFLDEIPLGSVEMQIAFSETGDYGPWLRSHDVMARVNGMVFVHAGPNVNAAAVGCAGTNARARSDIKTVKMTDPGFAQSFLASPDGPLWFRGLVGGPPTPSSDEDVTAVLKALGGTHIIVGHTVGPSARIQAHSQGRVFQIDTGMLGGEFYPGGAPSALEIQNGTFTAVYLGKREVIVRGGGGL